MQSIFYPYYIPDGIGNQLRITNYKFEIIAIAPDRTFRDLNEVCAPALYHM